MKQNSFLQMNLTITGVTRKIKNLSKSIQKTSPQPFSLLLEYSLIPTGKPAGLQ